MSTSSPRLRLLLVNLVSVAGVAALSGCGAVSLAGSVAGAAVSVAGAAVSVGATVVTTGVKVTGKVIEKTIDVVSAPATAVVAD